MRHPILVILRCSLSREQSRELAVKVDQILRVFPPLEFVLCSTLSGVVRLKSKGSLLVSTVKCQPNPAGRG